MNCERCSGENGDRLVYACAGCADVGEVADQIGRELRLRGFASAKSSCLAGIGAGIPTFINAAKGAKEVVAIDGCEVFCAKKILENVGLEPRSVLLSAMGCKKSATLCTRELVNELTEKIMREC